MYSIMHLGRLVGSAAPPKIYSGLGLKFQIFLQLLTLLTSSETPFIPYKTDKKPAVKLSVKLARQFVLIVHFGVVDVSEKMCYGSK